MTLSIFIPLAAGLLLGLLVNYLADVLPHTRRLSAPVCLHCGGPFRLSDYLLLRRCRECGKRRSARNGLVLLAVVAVAIYVQQRFAPTPLDYTLYLLVLGYFALVTVTDIEHRLILHSTSVFGALLGLGIGWLKRGIVPTLIGGLAGFLFMFALYYLGVLFARYRARKMQAAGQEADDEEALGFGDVTLSTALGLLIGWNRIWIVLLQGILFAGIFGVFLILALMVVRRYKENALMVFMPYGPFLILSAFLTIYVPDWMRLIVQK